MDSVFLLEDGARSLFLQNIVGFFGGSYICLWSYLPPPSNCLLCMDGNGFYIDQETDELAASSSLENSNPAAAFDQYRKSIFILDNNDHHIPGFAFKNGVPYLEFNRLDLQRLSSNQAQMQFYMEARIKIAVFMGCGSGEIELGMSNITRVNMEMEMKNWFPTDFSRQLPYGEMSTTLPRDPILLDQNIPSSSSSSLRSHSMDQPEPSPLLFKQPFGDHDQVGLNQTLENRDDIQLLGPEGENAIMTNAILAVLCSTSSPSTSSNQTRPSAFKRFGSSLTTSSTSRTGVRRQDMLKRSISFFRTLNLERIRALTSAQFQHTISERKRREKLNESFKILRSLVLSPGTKKDKVSVLSNTIDYMSSLITQVSDLARKNQILEAKLIDKTQYSTSHYVNNSLTNETRVDVRLSHIDTSATSTSKTRMVDLHALVRGNICLSNMMTRLLEFLNHDENISLISVNTEILTTESIRVPINRIILGLNINQDVEWDEASFQEAVRRLLADLAQSD